jgi:hypothetical protein
VRGEHDAIRQAIAAAVLITKLSNALEVLLEERGAVLLVGEVDVDLDGGAGDQLAVECSPIEQGDRVPLQLSAHHHESLERVLLSERVDAARIGPSHSRRDEEAAGDRLVQRLDEVARAALAHRRDEPDALELLQVVVDLLAGLPYLSRNRRRRAGLPQCLEDPHPEGMAEHLERPDVLDHVHRLGHARSFPPRRTLLPGQ